MDMVATVLADPINLYFCAAILGFAAVALVGVVTRRGQLGRLGAVAPGMLTGAGVLGTFVGIFQGLIGFDVNDISASVPRLLEGMKTAFATSVVGMSCGLLVKLVGEAVPRTSAGPAPEEVGAAELLAALHELRDATATRLDAIRQAVGGDGEASMVTQLQKLRASVGDRLEALDKAAEGRCAAVLAEMRAISTRLAEDNAKAFIAALENAIRDFNDKLTEQFGQNFKELNVAVGRLLEWQAAYRVQMEETARRLDASVVAAEASAGALTVVAERSAAVVEASARLADLLGRYEALHRELAEGLGGFAAMGREAQSAMPRIQERLDALTAGFARAVTEAVAEHRKSADALSDGFQRMRDAAGEAVRKVSQETEALIQTAQQNQTRILEASRSQLEATIRETNDKLATRLEEQTRRTGERLQKQVETLDGALQEELTRAIELLGSRLAAVSGHLAQDYTQLAGRLRSIAEAAQRAA